MDRAKFFAALRRRESGVFGTSLSQPQVDGTNAIIDSARRNLVTDPRHVANVLAQVYHETGGYMLPIKETVYASHKDKNPSDAVVMARLESAWKAGRLPWVKTPYWRAGWFGRGPLQITHEENYRRMGNRLGVNLVGSPALALDPKIGADIAVVGMMEGMFRSGHSLPVYFSASRDDPKGARNIVNGDATKRVPGKTITMGQQIADYHRAFLAAIDEAGGLDSAPVTPVKPSPVPLPPEKPKSPSPATTGGLASMLKAIFAALGAMLNRKK